MRESQTTADVLMIRPASFCANAQTAESNRFQYMDGQPRDPQGAALREFDALTSVLRRAGVRVHVFDDTPEPQKPDALFPNNWVSFHADGTVVLYPMLAQNRRWERRLELLESLSKHHGFHVQRIVDLAQHENEGLFLEGTGSLVLDRVHHIAYACLSPRTHPQLLGEFAQRLDYEVVAFEAVDTAGVAIYHTNVVMSIGRRFAVVCTAAIRDHQRLGVLSALRGSGHEVIELTHEQMNHFAGNVLELTTAVGEHVIALSERAFKVLSAEQRARLEALGGRLVTAAIPTIETLGGGSVRCLLAEIHLPRGTV